MAWLCHVIGHRWRPAGEPGLYQCVRCKRLWQVPEGDG